MKDLRVYVKLVGAETLSRESVFYSRRADGPYYCWRYAEESGWRACRIGASDLRPQSLLTATWKAVPTPLQAKLREHYLE